MIDELEKYVKISDLRKGMDYDNRKVKYVGTAGLLNGKNHRFIVSSEHTTRSYVVRIDIDEEDEIINTSCTCPQFLLTDSCKHVAAVLIKFQNELFLIDKKEQNKRKIMEFLNEIKQASLKKSTIKKEAKIVPYLKLEKYMNYYDYEETEEYDLRFKVGDKKLYVLGNKVNVESI